MSKLDADTVRTVMLHAVRCPSVARQLQRVGITADEFMQSRFPEYACLWEAVVLYSQANGTTDMPSFLIMESLLSNVLHNNSDYRQWTKQMQGFLRYIFQVPAKDLNDSVIARPEGPLQGLIDELKMAPIVAQLADEQDNDRRNSLLTQLNTIRSTTRVNSGQRIRVFSPENMRKATAAAKFRATGVEFIDNSIGGLPPVCACGLLGGTGGGKTTFSVQYSSECVFRKLNVLYLQYEEQVTNSSLLKRFMSYGANLSRDQLSGDFDEYSDEIKEKFEVLDPMFEEHCHMYSMAGDFANQGNGGIPEIEAIIESEIQSGWRPDVIMIDHLKPFADRWVNMRRYHSFKDTTEQYSIIVGGIAQLRDKFSCQVWLLHQIAAGILEKMSPATRPDKNIAENLKSFPNLLNFCFCLGKKDEDSGCLWFGLPKARDTDNLHRIIKLDAQYNRFVDALGYELNDFGGLNNEAYFKHNERKVRNG